MNPYKSPLKCLNLSQQPVATRKNSVNEVSNVVDKSNNSDRNYNSPKNDCLNYNRKSWRNSTPNKNESYSQNSYYNHRFSTPHMRSPYQMSNQKYYQANDDQNKFKGNYYKPSMLEDPWKDLMEKENSSS